MIHNTQTVNIDGTTINKDSIVEVFSFNENDNFSRWVLRPVAILTTIGMGIALFFASAFLMLLSLALVPFVAIALWAVKTKVERDLAKADPVVDTQTAGNGESAEEAPTAI